MEKIFKPKKAEFLEMGFEQDPLGESFRDFGFEIDGLCEWTSYPVMYYSGQGWYKWDGENSVEEFFPKNKEELFEVIDDFRSRI